MIPGLPAAEYERMVAQYNTERDEKCLRSARYTAATGLVLLIIFAPFDYAKSESVFAVAITARLFACLAIAAIGVTLLTPFGRKFPYFFGFALLMIPILMLLVMMGLTDLHHSSYFSGLAIVLVAAGIIMVWEPAWTVALGMVAILSYGFASYLDDAPIGARFVENLFALMASGGLGVVTSVMRGRLDRNEFERRWQVAEAYQHKSNFFANLSHEIRTPVHVILGYADMLLDPEGLDDSERRQLLEKIRSQGTHLYRLLSDLLDTAKVEAGKMDVEESDLAIDRLVADIVAGFEPIAESGNLQISLSQASDLPLISSDEGKIRQILTNVIGNALKFTARGSVRIEVVRMRDVDRALISDLAMLADPAAPAPPETKSDPEIAILVTDTGIGIERSEFRALATDYRQSTAKATSKQRGTGLGLSLSRKLARLLGGQIGVSSTVGRGTTFALFLPERITPITPEEETADADESSFSASSYSIAATEKRA